MAYPNWLRRREAPKIYAIVGGGHRGYELTAEKLREKFPKVCPSMTRQTVAKWAKDDGWEQMVEEIKEQVRQELQQEILSTRKDFAATYRELIKAIKGEMKGLKPRTLTEAVNSLDKAVGRYLDLTGEGKIKMDVERMIVIVFNVLTKDEKIGRLLVDRQDLLLKEIHEQLDERSN